MHYLQALLKNVSNELTDVNETCVCCKDEGGPGSCPMAGFGISSVEPFGSLASVFSSLL
jgi:hypothetical protein